MERSRTLPSKVSASVASAPSAPIFSPRKDPADGVSPTALTTMKRAATEDTVLFDPDRDFEQGMGIYRSDASGSGGNGDGEAPRRSGPVFRPFRLQRTQRARSESEETTCSILLHGVGAALPPIMELPMEEQEDQQSEKPTKNKAKRSQSVEESLCRSVSADRYDTSKPERQDVVADENCEGSNDNELQSKLSATRRTRSMSFDSEQPVVISADDVLELEQGYGSCSSAIDAIAILPQGFSNSSAVSAESFDSAMFQSPNANPSPVDPVHMFYSPKAEPERSVEEVKERDSDLQRRLTVTNSTSIQIPATRAHLLSFSSSESERDPILNKNVSQPSTSSRQMARMTSNSSVNHNHNQAQLPFRDVGDSITVYINGTTASGAKFQNRPIAADLNMTVGALKKLIHTNASRACCDTFTTTTELFCIVGSEDEQDLDTKSGLVRRYAVVYPFQRIVDTVESDSTTKSAARSGIDKKCFLRTDCEEHQPQTLCGVNTPCNPPGLHNSLTLREAGIVHGARLRVETRWRTCALALLVVAAGVAMASLVWLVWLWFRESAAAV